MKDDLQRFFETPERKTDVDLTMSFFCCFLFFFSFLFDIVFFAPWKANHDTDKYKMTNENEKIFERRHSSSKLYSDALLFDFVGQKKKSVGE